MKSVVFIMTHHHSGHECLASSISTNSRIECFNTKIDYNHPTVLEGLLNMPHKTDNTAAMYFDTILSNAQIANDAFFKFIKFVYLIRDAKATMNLLVSKSKYSELGALRYYTFRLRRLAELASKTPGALFLTYRNIQDGKGANVFNEHFKLKEPISFSGKADDYEDIVSSKLCDQAQDAFERYLYYFKNQDLRFVL